MKERIDSVRYIGNSSTGKTGTELAEIFLKSGAKITMLAGAKSLRPRQGVRVIEFENFQDLDSSLQKILDEEDFDVVVHLAAVSDYSLKSIKQGPREINSRQVGKLESVSEDLILVLKPNFKILDRIKSYVRTKKPMVVGFKLTDSPSQDKRRAAAMKLFDSGQVDLVVLNDVSEITTDRHLFSIFDKTGKFQNISSVQSLGEGLLGFFSGGDPL
jgi:phosphopantothenoylcysteine synthetase/decarboxylase